MSTALSFPFSGRDVRVVGTKDAPHFVAADVCAVLDITNNRNAMTRLDDDEKGVHTVDTLGGPQEMATVTESGVYHLAFSSRKPEAKTFRRWVTDTVLPAIRKSGSYTLALRPLDDCRRLITLNELCSLQLPEYTRRQLETACVDAYRTKFGESPPTVANPVWSRGPRELAAFPEHCIELLTPIVRRYSPILGERLQLLPG